MAVKEGPQEQPKGAQDNETVEGSLFDIAHDPAYLTHPMCPRVLFPFAPLTGG